MADIFGTTGSDVLNGTSGDDNIFTQGGNDTVNAGDGNDTVIIPAFASAYGSLNGGNGIDTLRLDASGFFNQVLTPFGYVNYQFMSFAGVSSFSSFERFQFNSSGGTSFEAQLAFGGSSGQSSLIGSGLAANAEIIGGAGDDRLTLIYTASIDGGSLTAPSFTYTGWATPNRAYHRSDTITVVINGPGATTLTGSAHSGVQELIGGSGNDTINGSNDMDLISGGLGGSDNLFGNGGDDTFSLVNTYTYNSSTGIFTAETTRTGAGTTYHGGSGTDFMQFGGNVDFQGALVSIEGIYLAPAFSNSNGSTSQFEAFVTIASSSLSGLASNLIFDGNGTVQFNLAAGGTTLSASAYTFDPGSFVALIFNGGIGNDTIIGSSRDDIVLGGAGADTLTGGDGGDLMFSALAADLTALDYLAYPFDNPLFDHGAEVDSLDGGIGDDIILAGYGDSVDGGAGGDSLLVSFLIAPGALNIDLSAPTIVIGGGTITGIEHIAQTEGSNFGDTITVGGNAIVHTNLTFVFGMDGNDLLTGSGGIDVLAGGADADTLSGLDGDDELYSAGLAFEPGKFYYDYYEVPTMDAGTDVDSLSGGAGDDRIYAGFGDNIDGGADGPIGDALFLSLRGAGSGQTIDFSILPASIGGGSITGIEHLIWVGGSEFDDDLRLGNDAVAISGNASLFGWGGNDILRGNDGHNVIGGGSGADALFGGDGSDYMFSAFQSDHLGAPINMMSGYVVPNLDTGTDADFIDGGAGDDIISAGYGDTVNGGTNGGLFGDTLHISFLGAGSGVTANFQLASQTIGGGTISGIETIGWIQGSNFGDSITGGSPSSNGMAILGMGGDDTIVAPSATFINGGEGDDTISGAGTNLGWIIGGDGNDTITSVNSARTKIEGGTGNDTIYANGGWTFGGSGDDVIIGGSFAGNAAFVMMGEDGNDQITAGTGGGQTERISGGSGADILTGSSNGELLVTADFAADTTDGGEDNGSEIDTVNAGGGNDEVWIGFGDSADGGAGTDRLFLSLLGAASGVTLNTASLIGSTPSVVGGGTIVNFESLSRLRGSNFDDVITVSGLTAQLTISTGNGNDTLTATNSTVTYFAGAGDDWFNASPAAATTYLAGSGTDTASFATYTAGITINLGTVANTGFVTGPNGVRLNSVENLVGGSGNDTLTGDSLANLIDGGGGIDTLNGEAGNDRLVVSAAGSGTSVDGGADSDTLVVSGVVTPGAISNMEAIELVGGASLTLSAAQFNTGFYNPIAQVGMASVSGTGSLVFNMDFNPVTAALYLTSLSFVPGSSVTLTINGTSGLDAVKGAPGVANTINGGDEADQIRGGSLADTIDGGNGNDKLFGWSGADVLTGGAGSDQFRYFFATDSGLGAAADRITDFQIGVDKFNFVIIDADPITPDDQAFAFLGTGAFTSPGTGQIRFQDSGADLLVQVDVDGNGTVDMEVVLQGLAGQVLTSGDFML